MNKTSLKVRHHCAAPLWAPAGGFWCASMASLRHTCPSLCCISWHYCCLQDHIVQVHVCCYIACMYVHVCLFFVHVWTRFFCVCVCRFDALAHACAGVALLLACRNVLLRCNIDTFSLKGVWRSCSHGLHRQGSSRLQIHFTCSLAAAAVLYRMEQSAKGFRCICVCLGVCMPVCVCLCMCGLCACYVLHVCVCMCMCLCTCMRFEYM